MVSKFKNHKGGIIASAVALSLLVSAAAVFSFGAPAKADELLNVEYGTMANTSFLGMDLSGDTEKTAKTKVDNALSDLKKVALKATGAEEGEEWTASVEELGVTFEEDRLTEDFDNAVLRGSLMSRYKKAKDYAEGNTLRLKAHYDEAAILEKVQDALRDWNGDPVESTATCRNGELEIVVGRNGHEYHFENGVKAFVEALEKGEVPATGFELPMEYTTVEAVLSPERVKDFTVIGTFTTDYDKPTSQVLENRQQNLIRSTTNMSGRVFAPGEVISALGLYGAVTAANGYASAGTYTQLGHEDQIGGGICQTTSTMYNAVLMAELEIVYRRNHSYTVDYLQPSRDAMVYAAGGSDFKFRNSSSDYIIIDAYVDTEANTLTVNIIGHEDHPATHSVRYETEILAKDFPGIIRIDSTDDLVLGWAPNEKKFRIPEDSGFHPQIKSRLWKITTDDGIETRSIVGGTDTYKPMNGFIEFAPDAILVYKWRNKNDLNDLRLEWDLCFINEDQTMLVADYNSWTDEELEAFNAEMTELMAEKGYEWPDQGATVSRYVDGEYVRVRGEDPTEEESTEEPEPGDEPEPENPGGDPEASGEEP